MWLTAIAVWIALCALGMLSLYINYRRGVRR